MVNPKKILLVAPRCLDDRLSAQDAQVTPIGLYYIAALLRENNFDTRLLNLAQADPGNPEGHTNPEKPGDTDPVAVFKKEIMDHPPDIIGFSVTNPNRINAIECAIMAKKILPSVTVVFGGPAPTFLAEHLFEACPALDVIIPGEGEISFFELVSALENGQNLMECGVRGLIVRQNDRIIHTPARPLLNDLDTLVHPSRYFTYQHLAMSRGCPGNCTFCGSPEFWKSRQVRSHCAQWFADEIEALFKKGVTHFYISDDTFTMDKTRVIELCHLILEKKLPITFNAISRVDYIDADILHAMRMAGCIQISYGVESGALSIRKTLGKPILQEKIIQAFELTRSYGILPRAYFIYGSPMETSQTIQKSIDLLTQIQPLSAIFYMLVIFPGTYLYRSAEQKNLVNDSIWHQNIEDLPWFEIDPDLDFEQVKKFGDTLRSAFYRNVHQFARNIDLVDKKELYPFHADFLSRLAMTFSHGEYALDSRVKDAEDTARRLFEKAIVFAPEARAFLGLGMLMQKKRQFHDAVHLLEKGLQHHPGHPDLTICIGTCLMNLGRFKKALAFFEPLDHLDDTRHYINICRQQISGQ